MILISGHYTTHDLFLHRTKTEYSFSMKPLIQFLPLVLICFSSMLYGDPLRLEPLFKIERSKNANIIQYDAQLGPDGKLDTAEPVIAYWVRLAEQGQIQELSWLQKEFAFGFDADYDPVNDFVSIEMAVDIGRSIAVVRDGDRYRARTTIDGSDSYLEKIYIKARKRHFLIKVFYIDLFGKDSDTGEERYERFVP